MRGRKDEQGYEKRLVCAEHQGALHQIHVWERGADVWLCGSDVVQAAGGGRGTTVLTRCDEDLMARMTGVTGRPRLYVSVEGLRQLRERLGHGLVLEFLERATVEGIERAWQGGGMAVVAPPPEPEPNIAPELDFDSGDAHRTTIDWQAFVFDDGHRRGISLRAMVEAGLYEQMHGAVQALRASELRFSHVHVSGHGPGQSAIDYVLPLRDAQLFAARARTEMGRRILEVIIAHHEEYQALLEGNREAEVRLHEERSRRGAVSPEGLEEMAANLMQQAALVGRLVAGQARVEGRVSQLESWAQEREEVNQRRPGELPVTEVARRAGWLSRGGHPHNLAIILACTNAGFRERALMRHLFTEAFAGQGEDANPYWVLTADGVRVWEEEVRPRAEAHPIEGWITVAPNDAARRHGYTRNCHVRLDQGAGEVSR